jgi:S-adenosylmethionine synthetase
METYLFTSESVTEGHPDKMCDQISDAVLDEVLSQDTNGRVACETLTTRGLVFIAGEITTDCYIDIPATARKIMKETGYTEPSFGFHYDSSAVITSIQEQSPDIAMGVDTGGAGDQGIMFGYATNETQKLLGTNEFMPLPITLAHKLSKRLAEVRKEKLLDYLRPDGKSQVTALYEDGAPKKIVSVVLSSQHNPGVSVSKIKDDLTELVIKKVIPAEVTDKDIAIHVNPTGSFVVGGPQADTGVTGRKIIVDTYGGIGSHGGGCFSGKDPSKVDRSASYFARYLAKNIVASGMADKCEIQLGYIIGEPQPVSIMVDTKGTGRKPNSEIVKNIKDSFDLSPRGIIKYLDLLKPIYRETACYGHFGREGFSWENTNNFKLAG